MRSKKYLSMEREPRHRTRRTLGGYMLTMRKFLIQIAVMVLLAAPALAQTPASAKVELGSETARNGFKNEDTIRDKFNNWKADADARAWLEAMNYRLADVVSVSAVKPHGEKSDVDVTVTTQAGVKTEGISIKLVSSAIGFNQIDKRWLSHYVKMWNMPADVATALKLFVGETPPVKAGRSPDRMFLDELEAAAQAAVIAFFAKNRTRILHDLFTGDGPHAARWFMVALRATDKPRWIIKPDADAIRFFGDGLVELTAHGNLKIGRITVQRKGGDAGRDTAKMLQFKINPALLFDLK